MSISVRILKEAAEEAAEAAAWYETESAGLGAEFAEALEAALDFIEDPTFPLVPVFYKHAPENLKRLILKRFPYDVVVLTEPDERIIVAIAHHARKPGYWRDRTDHPM